MTYVELDYLNSVKSNLPEIAKQLEIQNKIELYKLGVANASLDIDVIGLLDEIKKALGQ